MADLIPFSFESHSIRVLTDDNGEPLFVAKDIAVALGYANTNDAISTHCKGVAERYPLQTKGGTQEVRVIREPDLYRMMANSQLPTAQEFERLVFEEILPTIRKTGKYEFAASHRKPARVTPAQEAKAALAWVESTLSIAKMIGADEPMARVVAVDIARERVGVDFSRLLIGNTVDEAPMTSTELGREWGLTGKIGEKMNAILLDQGYAMKNESGDWVPTENGKPYATVNPFKSPHSHHTGYRTLWYRRILDVLKKEEMA